MLKKILQLLNLIGNIAHNFSHRNLTKRQPQNGRLSDPVAPLVVKNLCSNQIPVNAPLALGCSFLSTDMGSRVRVVQC